MGARDDARTYWNNNIIQNAAQSITGQKLNVGGVDNIIDVATFDDEIVGRMLWKNEWVAGEYNQYDVVRDGDWTMVANKTTNDKPAPQPSGEPYYLYTGTIGTNTATAKQIIFGQRITTGVSGGYINGYRVYTVAGNFYSVFVVSNPLGTPVFNLVLQFTATADGWTEFAISPIILPPATVFDIICNVSEPDPTPTTFTGPWNYLTPNNPGTPAAGTIDHANTQTDSFRIHKTDNNSVDRSAELLSLRVGDIIDGVNQRWSIQFFSDQGTYVDFTVAPAQQGAPDGVATFTFETVTATPITYGEDLDFWSSNPNVQGLFIEDGQWSDIVPDESQYGIDILIQNATVSTDWDLLALSGGTGGGGDWVPYYVFDKATGVTVTAAQNLAPPNNWQNICDVEYGIESGDTVYEFKISLTWTYSTTARGSYIRYSIDNGSTWNEFVREPKDVSDVYVTYYAFPQSYSQLSPTSSRFLLDVSKQDDTDIMLVNFADVMVERVK